MNDCRLRNGKLENSIDDKSLVRARADLDEIIRLWWPLGAAGGNRFRNYTVVYPVYRGSMASLRRDSCTRARRNTSSRLFYFCEATLAEPRGAAEWERGKRKYRESWERPASDRSSQMRHHNRQTRAGETDRDIVRSEWDFVDLALYRECMLFCDSLVGSDST